jgi:hypothetical protein
MAKTVTSMLIGIAIAEGRIRSVDDLPTDYVPARGHGVWADARRGRSITSSRFASIPPVARSPSTVRRSGCPLARRPIHMTTDIPSENILVAFNNPSALHAYRINPDFTPGEEVKQPGPVDAGIFAHQVRVTPDNRLAILMTRGNEGTPAKAEDPGALKVFDYKNGVLTNVVSIAPDGGRNFGPRHLDFRRDARHPCAHVSHRSEWTHSRGPTIFRWT